VPEISRKRKRRTYTARACAGARTPSRLAPAGIQKAVARFVRIAH
jgi:hypothetical protein